MLSWRKHAAAVNMVIKDCNSSLEGFSCLVAPPEGVFTS